MSDLFLATFVKFWIFSSQLIVQPSAIDVPGAWQELSQTSTHCLMYRAPLKGQEGGELAIYKRKNETPCLDNIARLSLRSLEVDSRPKLEFKNSQLKLTLASNKQTLEKVFPVWGDAEPKLRDAYIGAVKNRSKFLNIGDRCDGDCDLCPKGHSWLIGKEEVYRACVDPATCGESGEPACYLGSDWYQGHTFCSENSKSGWCKPGLKTRCSEETGYLECE
tara:strand:- start:3835 stop:4494 length:660 start_codon:yes stop_codon:yes gene_type:complete